jgi:hypothetical protein
MKKVTLCIFAVISSFVFVPLQTKAETEPNKVSSTHTVTLESAQANSLVSRLFAIKTMDISNMGSSEKRELRKEVRGIKGQLKELGGGIYLSVGAIIVIILLLILLA